MLKKEEMFHLKFKEFPNAGAGKMRLVVFNIRTFV